MEPLKRISIKDVALEAGVSIATVSYVLNKTKNQKISAETVARVHRAVELLNYTPNALAKSLKLRRSYTIGLLVADIANPYFSRIARLIDEELRKSGYTTLMASCNEQKDNFQKLSDMLRTRQIDGLIITPVEGCEQTILQLVKEKVPFVMLDRYIPIKGASGVKINNFEISYEAASKLLTEGRQHLLFIDIVNRMHHLNDRMQGFKTAHKALGISCNRSNILRFGYHDSNSNIAAQFEKVLQNNQINGLIFSNNNLALRGLKAIIDLKLRIPDDLAVIIFDENETLDLFTVPLSFIRQPIEQMCNIAIQILWQKMADQTEKGIITLNAELINRTSSII